MRHFISYLILSVLLFANDGWTISASMVKDMNTAGPNESSRPGSIAVIADQASEIWRTDGTSEGTEFVVGGFRAVGSIVSFNCR